MKHKLIWKTTALLLVLVSATLIFSCENSSNSNLQGSNPYANQPVGNAQSPTEAYKMLFAAVKSKDTEKIKSMMSKNSHGLAQFAAGQQKKPIEEVFSNGFTETTFAASLPEIRDERIKDGLGAIEVWNANKKLWENLPFVKEYDVILQDMGANKDAVVKAFAEAIGAKPEDAQKIIDGTAPKTIGDHLNQIEAEKIKTKLTEAGATVEVKESGGGWKFAIGDAFKGTFEFPGKAQSIREQEAANAQNPNLIPAMPPNVNMNNVKPTIIDTNSNSANKKPKK